MTEELPQQQVGINAILDRPAPTEVQDVVARLDELQAVMDQFNGRPENPVASFNRLYRVITEEVRQRLDRAAFQDPEFMKKLDLRFAGLYFNAVQQWNDHTAQAPRCWSGLFNRWNDDNMAPMVGALAGVTAHIRFDLGVALVQTFKEMGQSILTATQAQEADFKVLDKIFAEKIPSLRREMLDGNPIADLIDRALGNWDDLVQAATVAEAREESWEEAERLWPFWDRPNRYADEIRTLDGRTKSEIDRLFFVLDNPFGNFFLGSGLF